MAYDKVGNRTNIKTHVITAPGEDTGEVTHDTDRYFEYDAMNRQTKAHVNAKGELGTTGHEIKYDKAGNKISDTWLGNQVTVTPGTTYTQTVYGPNGDFENTYSTPNTYSASLGLTTEAYTYDARGKVVGIDRDGVRVDTRFYDAAGRTCRLARRHPWTRTT
ncbi:hypothetical protein [Caenimonas sp. SL110]|uniref:hypothetical protein n=1 Tax=Caenimonas sp. SL110 TaxID=1450524 RepID=UPI00128E358C|nr:hypothetical protein [Caenimonas sp. SL110]